MIPTKLGEWLESNDLAQAFEFEKKKRKFNLDKILNSNLGNLAKMDDFRTESRMFAGN